ncbi:bromodomain containing protein [Nitzschia inconspicua]|uniref:Bromodomain containing protein n=1 Tax=Nitzschia inconspicua TaxID=303405 RepID=A0A9K3M4X7_9STRA|nr:bromodomain containing protein [Nitzschia inconspicua]
MSTSAAAIATTTTTTTLETIPEAASGAEASNSVETTTAVGSTTTTTGRNVGDDKNSNNKIKKRPRSDTETSTSAAEKSENTKKKSEYLASFTAASAPTLKPLLESSLYDMVQGLPRTEMKLIIEEAKQCEQALEEELELLKQALKEEQKKKSAENMEGTIKNESKDDTAAVDLMLESDVTPPDHYWTVSSLLGRLRHDLTTPLPPNSQLRLLRETPAAPPISKKRKSNSGGPVTSEDGTVSGRITPNFTGILGNSEISQFERLKQIQKHPDYKVQHETPDKLLAVWKKISTHRSSLVFRRPVNPKDAPGYSDRIHFPMDLSLIRKLIVNQTIRSYHDIAMRIHLIGHNCVKYNGRESDYALVTREFESYSAEFLMNATLNHGTSNAMPMPPNPMGRPAKKRSGTPTVFPSITTGPGMTSDTTGSKQNVVPSSSATSSAPLPPSNASGTEIPQNAINTLGVDTKETSTAFSTAPSNETKKNGTEESKNSVESK